MTCLQIKNISEDPSERLPLYALESKLSVNIVVLGT